MIITARLQLNPAEESIKQLRELFTQAVAARQAIAERANKDNITFWLELNRAVYHEVKKRFGLPANLVQSIIRQVATCRKRHGNVTFRSNASLPLIGRYVKPGREGIVKIKVMDGYCEVPFSCGDSQRKLLLGKWKEAKFTIDRHGQFVLFVACEIQEAEPIERADVLGIDLGIVNLATDSTGQSYSGSAVQEKRRIHSHRRRNLQRNGSRMAKRKLRWLSGKQQRYQRHVNHVISKRIVAKAFDAGHAIAIENLKGIRDRVNVRRRQRASLHNWGFWQLRSFIEYKARRIGVAVIPVNPRNTSRECTECHFISRKNRPSQAVFKCQSCGFVDSADSLAARNIRARALTEKPMVAVN